MEKAILEREKVVQSLYPPARQPIDFHEFRRRVFSFSERKLSGGTGSKLDSEDRRLFSYVKVFLAPTLLLKALILYFGLNYARFPEEGYGWGLVAAIALSLINFATFIYLNWQDESEES